MTKSQVAGIIDHTLLDATATKSDIERLCKEAVTYGFASVCVNPFYVPFAAEKLQDSKVRVCTVIGFPFGADSSLTKAFSAKDAVLNGADELDMVINISQAKNGNFEYVEDDIKSVVIAAKDAGKELGKQITVKAILETCYLTDEEIVQASLVAKNAGADFIKTSTGFGTPKTLDGTILPNGASVHHVELMKKTVGDSVKIKASGSIRSVHVALELINAGADRLGTSSGLFIYQNWQE